MMILIVLLILVSIVLALFVLIQNPKGGGLVTGGSGSNMFGVKRTGDVLEKGTWVLVALVVVLSLSITTIAKTGGQSSKALKVQEQLDKTVTPSPIGSNLPASKPAADTSKK